MPRPERVDHAVRGGKPGFFAGNGKFHSYTEGNRDEEHRAKHEANIDLDTANPRIPELPPQANNP